MSSSRNLDDHCWQSSKWSVLERSCFMFNNPLLSDISIRCGEKKVKLFNAHKYVLAISSPVFYAMFYGESYNERNQDSIHFEDADDDSFEELLRFIYTDKTCEMSPDLAVRVLYQAKKYLIPVLACKCIDILVKNITPDNVLVILEEALRFDEKDLEQKCWKVIETDASRVLASQPMCEISQQTMHAILKRDTIKIKEVELFSSLLKWLEFQCLQNNIEPTQENKRILLGDAFWNIRFLSMCETEFAHFVSSCGLLNAQESLSLFQRFNGVANADFPWKHTERGIDLQRLSRFDVKCIMPPDASWSYQGCPDRLTFMTSKQMLIHGVHLFGSRDGKYQVTLEIGEESVTGMFSSEFVRCGQCSWFGFDVMLKKPVKLNKGVKIEMSALIQGPASYYYGASKLIPSLSSIDVGAEVRITFFTSNKPANGTDMVRGQFCELIYQHIERGNE